MPFYFISLKRIFFSLEDFQVADEICQILNYDSDIPENRRDLLDKVVYQDADLENKIRRENLLVQAKNLSLKLHGMY